MAAATASVTITNSAPNRSDDVTERSLFVYGTVAITPSPATYTTGGIACTFASYEAIKTSLAPFRSRIESQPAAGSGAATKYLYQYLPGADNTKGLLQIFTGAAAQSALTELSAGAIPAGVSGDTIVAEFQFSKFIN